MRTFFALAALVVLKRGRALALSSRVCSSHVIARYPDNYELEGNSEGKDQNPWVCSLISVFIGPKGHPVW